jgi:hypothetical protein
MVKAEIAGPACPVEFVVKPPPGVGPGRGSWETQRTWLIIVFFRTPVRVYFPTIGESPDGLMIRPGTASFRRAALGRAEGLSRGSRGAITGSCSPNVVQ